MRLLPISSSLVLALLAGTANASTYYVAPNGVAATECTTRDNPCSLTTIAGLAVAGDTVIIGDGVYKEQLMPLNSGTADKWISFQADECATPIIEGPGVGPEEDVQQSGVETAVVEYIRYVGLVVRGWNTGFGNKWTDKMPVSNGHLEYVNCIADGNGRTGFTFYSASGLHIKNCISSHNGSSLKHSWSSGITLLQAGGGPDQNIVEGSISFENMDNQREHPDNPTLMGHTDGSGFIVDEDTQGATFVNNIAFRNGGSCLRLTKSPKTRFINNVCYHNAQDPLADWPSDPDELYFTKDDANTVVQDVTFSNNVFVAAGNAHSMSAVNSNKPTKGWGKNIEKVGAVTFFTDPEGMHPDFTIKSGSSDLTGKGETVSAAPKNDLGFDPKCIVKRAPTLVGQTGKGDWWQYDVDLAYIQKIGGVAKCWNPKARSGAADIGAYVAAGFTAPPVPSMCPTPPAPKPMPSASLTSGSATMPPVNTSSGAAASASTGGTPPGSGTAAGTNNAGGSNSGAAAMPASAATGTVPANGTAPTAGTTPTAGASGANAPITGGNNVAGSSANEGGCSLTARPRSGRGVAALSVFGLVGGVGLLARRRRRQSRTLR